MTKPTDNFKGAPDELIGKSVQGEALAELLEKAKARVRASHGNLDEKGTGPFSGRRAFIIAPVFMGKNPKRGHGLKKHFKYHTCAHELAGLLDSLVEQFPRPDRFVFPSMDYLMNNCFKGERAKGQNYKERELYYTLSLFRQLGIVSPLMHRDMREGLIVAPHAALFVCAEKHCRFIGPLGARQKAAGWFSTKPDGYIWHPAEEKIECETE